MPLGPRHGRTVYALSSSQDGIVRYVGSTSKSPAQRAKELTAAARCGRYTSPVEAWIRSVLAAGFNVQAATLMEDACVWCERVEVERRFAAGEPLLNVQWNPNHYAPYLAVSGTWGRRVSNGLKRLAGRAA